nr:MAG TPA_asm: hypothetical protein [Bacteriophage sp.]
MSASELMRGLGLKHRPSFRGRYFERSLACGLIERTISRQTNQQQAELPEGEAIAWTT